MATNLNFKVKNGLDAGGDISTTGFLKSNNSSGTEGGQVDLAKAATGTTLTTGVTIDVNGDKLRFFETGGTNRGFYLDISAGGTSVGSQLTTGGGGGGGLTSVGLSVPTGMSVSNSPLTANGTLAVSLSSGYNFLNSNSDQTIAGVKVFTSNDTRFLTAASSGARFYTSDTGTSPFVISPRLNNVEYGSSQLYFDATNNRWVNEANFYNSGTASIVGNTTISGITQINSTATSPAIGSGALVVSGGVSIGEVLRVSSNIHTSGTMVINGLSAMSYDGTTLKINNVDNKATQIGISTNSTDFLSGANGAGTYIRYLGASRLGVTSTGTIAASGVYGNNLSSSYRAVYVTSSTAPDTLGYVASSRSMKKAIEPLSYTAEQILSIEPIEYLYNPEPDTNPKHAGFIVEDLEDAGLHAYISYGEDGVTPETINYEFYVSALQQVVRHQASQISDLQARLTALENK